MSRLAIDDMFYGKPGRVPYATGGRGGSGGYGGVYQLAGPHYYSDGDDCYNHRHSGNGGRASLYPTAVSSRPTLPDVRLSVPMDSLRCVEKLKEALDISGVYSVHCDIPTQTVTVSGSVGPQALLKRAKHVKRKAKILSYTNVYTDQYSHHHGRTSSATAMSYGNMSPFYDTSSNYYRSVSPPRDHHLAYDYSWSNHHSFGGYSDPYRPSHEHHYTHYY